MKLLISIPIILFAILLLFFSVQAEDLCKEKGGIRGRTTQGYSCIKAETIKEIK